MNVARWFHDQGVWTFPIKDRSKEPACRWTEFEPTEASVGRYTNYGVRLGIGAHDGSCLAVLDPDSDDLVRAVRANGGVFDVPDTPFMVKTARGLHLYYRLHTAQGVPKFIRRAGLSIEFRNKGQYTVGPGSVHPSGVVYRAIDWSWRWEDIPFFPVDTFCFDDRQTDRGHLPGSGIPYLMPDEVLQAERHEQLNSLIASLVTSSAYKGVAYKSQEQLWPFVEQYARLFCANICKPPLPWDGLNQSFVMRSYQGALKLRDRQPTTIPPIGLSDIF